MPGRHVLWLEDCTADRAELVGGKAVGLAALLRAGLRVPGGFAVTTEAYRECVLGGGLHREIARALRGADSIGAQQKASKRIRRLFESAAPPDRLTDEVARAYERLSDADPAPVAVRSSATAEDTAEASFAGQQETYLWVRGADAVAHHVVRCWGSLFTPQAISYRSRLAVPLDRLAMAVVVQRMVPAEVSGVMLTIDPVTGDRSQISIEASYGLGLAVVGGEVTPDRYTVDKVTLEVRRQEVGGKHLAYRFDPAAGEVRASEVPEELRRVQCLTRDEVVTVAGLGKRVERAMGAPQDVEWALGPGEPGRRDVFLLQTRPETVWSRRSRTPVDSPGKPVLERLVESMRRPVKLREGVAPRNVGT